MGQIPSAPAQGPLPSGAVFEVAVGRAAIRDRLDDALAAAMLGDPALDRLVTKTLGARPARCDDDTWRARKRRRLATRFAPLGGDARRRVAVFVHDRGGAYVGAATADVARRARTADVGAHFRGAAAPARRALLGLLLRELRVRRARVRTVRVDAAPEYAADFAAVGFARLKAQDPGRPDVVRMTARLGRWAVAGHVVVLAELLRRRRARAAAGPPRDAVARLVREVAAHDRDHWSHAFLRSAVRLL